jgi:hypothetical protein
MLASRLCVLYRMQGVAMSYMRVVSRLFTAASLVVFWQLPGDVSPRARGVPPLSHGAQRLRAWAWFCSPSLGFGIGILNKTSCGLLRCDEGPIADW